MFDHPTDVLIDREMNIDEDAHWPLDEIEIVDLLLRRAVAGRSLHFASQSAGSPAAESTPRDPGMAGCSAPSRPASLRGWLPVRPGAALDGAPAPAQPSATSILDIV